MSTDLIPIDDGALVARRPADEHPALVYLAGLNSAHSRRTMKQALDRIADLVSSGRADALALDWPALRFQHTAAIRARLAAAYAPATAKKMLSALRGVLRAARRLGQMSADEYQRAVDLEPIKGATLPAGRDLSAGEVAALMQACERDATAAGPRDALMLALLAAGGLRRAEAVALDLEDFDAAAGRLAVRGKGGKERTVYLGGGARDALDDWLRCRGDAPGPLLCPVDQAGRVTLRRLSSQTIYDALRKRAGEAGVKHFSPHDLRRTFVGDLLDAGADISTVAQMAGHASVTTTQRYDRRPEEAKRKAAALLHIPYRKRWR